MHHCNPRPSQPILRLEDRDLAAASPKDTLHDSEHLPQALYLRGFQLVLGLVFKRDWNLPASGAPRGGPSAISIHVTQSISLSNIHAPCVTREARP